MRGAWLWLLAGAVCLAPAAAAPASDASATTFGSEPASSEARAVMAWIAASGDNRGMPFVIVDKIAAKVFVFDAQGHLLGAAAALLGLGHGDDSVPGIGQRKLATI